MTWEESTSPKYGSGQGVLGVYPAGKLLAGSVHELVARYGSEVSGPVRHRRDFVRKVGVLTSEHQCPAFLDAVESVMRAIATTQTKAIGRMSGLPSEAGNP